MTSPGVADAPPATAASARVSPWLVLAVVFFASVAAVMAQFAAPPLMPVLMEAFRIDIGAASSLMSVFSITGVILALPAGLILGRFGPMATGLVAAAAIAVGSVIAASASDYGVLLAGRAVQGIAIGLIGVVAPAVVAAAFPPQRRGTPMGIWAMWVPVGGMLMYFVGPSLAVAAGWQAVWWMTAILGVVAFIGWAAVLSMAGLRGAAHAGASTRAAVDDLVAGIRNRDIGLLMLVFLLFATVAGASNTFITTFLTQERDFDVTGAAAITGLSMAGMAIGSTGAGMVIDRFGSRRRVIVGALLISAPALVLPYVLTGPLLLGTAMLAMGIALGAIPSGVFSAVPEVVPEFRLAGAGMAGVMLGQNAGFVVGPLLIAALLPLVGWTAAAALCGAVLAFSALVGWRVRVR